MKNNIILSFAIVLLTAFPVIASGGGGGGGGSSSSSGGGSSSSSGGGSSSSSGGGSSSSRSGISGGGFNKKSINLERALLGESLFLGKADIASKVISRSLYVKQGKILVRMKKQVDRARLISGESSSPEFEKFDPKALAGRMTSKQLSALRYYVKLKFDS